MRVRGLALLAVASALLAGSAGAEDPPDGLKPAAPATRRDPDFLKRVNHAIEQGLQWLRGQQRPDGSFAITAMERWRAGQGENLGPTALGVYTMRACGAPMEDPAVKRGLQWLRERWGHGRNPTLHDNYGVSLTVLALEAHYAGDRGADADQDRYGRTARAGGRIPDPDLEWLRELVLWLTAAETKVGAFSYGSPAHGSTHDHSNTQFSLLALKAARRCGVPVEPQVFRKSLDHLLDAQEKAGPEVPRLEDAGVDEERYGTARRVVGKDRARGWGYFDGSAATGSMTSGGVSSLVICRSELLGGKGYPESLDRRAEAGIRDGLAWLGLHFTVRENPGPPGAPMMREAWHYYYLYGLERAGVLAAVALMGTRDWYFEGARYLVEEQRDSGAWFSPLSLDDRPVPFPGAGPDAVTGTYLDTCFALLFLKRATFRVGRGTVTEEVSDSLDFSGAGKLDDDAFRDLFGAVFRRHLAASEDGRAGTSIDFVRMGPRAIPLLVLALEDAEEPRRAAASDALLRTTGETQGYHPAATPESRAAAVARWEVWWMERKATLAADAKAGRFGDVRK